MVCQISKMLQESVIFLKKGDLTNPKSYNTDGRVRYTYPPDTQFLCWSMNNFFKNDQNKTEGKWGVFNLWINLVRQTSDAIGWYNYIQGATSHNEINLYYQVYMGCLSVLFHTSSTHANFISSSKKLYPSIIIKELQKLDYF